MMISKVETVFLDIFIHIQLALNVHIFFRCWPDGKLFDLHAESLGFESFLDTSTHFSTI